ncbi:hypothetical protein [Paracoccus sp. (in: a-proteobacteria)]|uniref:hypothetical protein n=1 Tax=Paracoccus sp. TaxID=267 RepID=UPI0026DFC39E|nr:hypothetical protein [Paracoccus sp. (in: a-proteobacteria)]MDO5648545.1 hypothetical protein [Paracoccus sp. (in: a-proteobacteria)]
MPMPLPYFLLLICAVALAAAVTLWVSFAAGIPEIMIALIALSGVVALHLGQRRDRQG